MVKHLIPILFATTLFGAEGKVDPTWVHRYLPEVAAKSVDMSTDSCRYKPIFGEGDSQSHVARSVARFGEATVQRAGTCAAVSYPREEQIYVVLEGSGVLHYNGEQFPIHKNDFMYLPPGIEHSISGSSDQPCRFVVIGFRITAEMPIPPAPKLVVANLDDVKEQTVEGHPSSLLYKLMVGDRNSKRDKIAAGIVVVSLFLMDFAPGGTNLPHHHATAEEIYLILDGRGTIVAGDGTDGIEGRHPAHAGDAYFFRLNCTVGFYNSKEPGAKAHILAVRSRYPFSKEAD